jgi:hypothetical protein
LSNDFCHEWRMDIHNAYLGLKPALRTPPASTAQNQKDGPCGLGGVDLKLPAGPRLLTLHH